jgi:hypothetical protein
MDFGNLMNDYNIDVYAHFWWADEYKGENFAWNSQLTYSKDYDPIKMFNAKMNPKVLLFEKYPQFDLSDFQMVSQMEFPLDPDVVEKSIYRQKSQWTSVKKSIEMIEGDYDLVIRARTDLVFKEKVPLGWCRERGIYMMDGSLQAGKGREYCDWFYCGSQKEMKEFDPLKVYDDFYKNGIRHMHELVQHTFTTLAIPHCIVDLKTYMLDRSKL